MKITFNSPLILSFSLLCVIVLVFTNYLNVMQNWFTLQPNWGYSVRFYFSLFGQTLGHANLEHLIGNLSFILLLGPVVEKKYGSKLLLLIMLVTALSTSIIHIVFFNTGLLGASGIVFMLIILTSLVDIKSGEIPLTFILVSIIFLGKEILSSFDTDNISQTAHIIGGLVGAIFGFLLAGSQTKNNASHNFKD